MHAILKFKQDCAVKFGRKRARSTNAAKSNSPRSTSRLCPTSRLSSRCVSVHILSNGLIQLPAQESLRFHPVSYNHYREPAKDTVLPLSKPITTLTGKVINEIIVPKGTKMVTSVNGYHRYVGQQVHMKSTKGIFPDIRMSLGPMRTPSIRIGG